MPWMLIGWGHVLLIITDTPKAPLSKGHEPYDMWIKFIDFNIHKQLQIACHRLIRVYRLFGYNHALTITPLPNCRRVAECKGLPSLLFMTDLLVSPLTIHWPQSDCVLYPVQNNLKNVLFKYYNEQISLIIPTNKPTKPRDEYCIQTCIVDTSIATVNNFD